MGQAVPQPRSGGIIVSAAVDSGDYFPPDCGKNRRGFVQLALGHPRPSRIAVAQGTVVLGHRTQRPVEKKTSLDLAAKVLALGGIFPWA